MSDARSEIKLEAVGKGDVDDINIGAAPTVDVEIGNSVTDAGGDRARVRVRRISNRFRSVTVTTKDPGAFTTTEWGDNVPISPSALTTITETSDPSD